jgi:hypothetical protein
MNRVDFQEIAEIRVSEAEALLKAGHFAGAYYLIGYAVECALKACVSKQVKQFDFPDKKLANESFTHDLEKLVRISGLAPDFESDREADADLQVNWAVVKDWSESSRYDIHISERQARDLYSACTGENGILKWVKRRW